MIRLSAFCFDMPHSSHSYEKSCHFLFSPLDEDKSCSGNRTSFCSYHRPHETFLCLQHLLAQSLSLWVVSGCCCCCCCCYCWHYRASSDIEFCRSPCAVDSNHALIPSDYQGPCWYMMHSGASLPPVSPHLSPTYQYHIKHKLSWNCNLSSAVSSSIITVMLLGVEGQRTQTFMVVLWAT